MECFADIYAKAENVCKENDVLENYDSILSCLKNQDLINAFLDVLNPEKTYDDIKTYKFPALIDRNNGVLFTYICKDNTYFMIVWKELKIEPVIMKYEITPTAISSKNFDESIIDKTSEKETIEEKENNESKN
tara:strand:- start:4484 stop:4882 length:399 start_codon:yes stop_codon:yes gene_type:complete